MTDATKTAQIVPGSPEHDAAMIAIAEKGAVEVRLNGPGEGAVPSDVIKLAQTSEEKAAADAAAVGAEPQ